MKDETPMPEEAIPDAIGAASLDPRRRKVGQVLAFGGLAGFAVALATTLLYEPFRVPAALFVLVFFFAWKIGKTILRGNLDRF